MEKSLNQLKNSNIYLNLRTYPNFGSRLFGQLELSVHEKVEIGDAIYLTATIKRVSDYTLPKHLDLVDNLLVLLRRKLNKKPFNFIMDDKDLRAFALFYSLPRPVVLVSVSNDGYDNLFPMDLIGSLKGEDNNEIYSLSLRQTSPSIELMLKSKQVAIAGVPIHQSELVYQLGEHHKKKSIDWSELSIQAIHSKEYELRVPEWSTQIEELLIKNSFELGSHRVFLCSTVSSVKRGRAELMHHVSGRFMKLIRKEK